MIGSLRGRISAKSPPQLTVDVGGIGYEIEAPMSTFFHLPAVGAEVQLLTHLVVREDAHVLYGFGTEEERRLFRSLIKVSGVGPKIALGAALGHQRERAFSSACSREDIAALTRIPGRGPQDRRAADRGDARPARGTAAATRRRGGGGTGQPREPRPMRALVALGYRPAEATRLLKARRARYTFHRGTDPPRPPGRGAGVEPRQ